MASLLALQDYFFCERLMFLQGLDLKDVTYLADMEGEGLSLHHLHQADQPKPDGSDQKEKDL